MYRSEINILHVKSPINHQLRLYRDMYLYDIVAAYANVRACTYMGDKVYFSLHGIFDSNTNLKQYNA